MKNNFNCEKLLRSISLVVLVGLFFYILYYTVFSRETGNEINYNLELFWSYSQDSDITHYNFWMNIWNVILFLPVGILIGLAFKKIKWWVVFIVGAFLSIIIEVLQLVLRRGLCEIDDIFHNTLGCMMGFLIIRGVISIIKEK